VAPGGAGVGYIRAVAIFQTHEADVFEGAFGVQQKVEIAPGAGPMATALKAVVREENVPTGGSAGRIVGNTTAVAGRRARPGEN
jgi:hypothetical protein